MKLMRHLMKTILLFLALLAGVSSSPALTPGPRIILECPGCKRAVRELTIGSGNTFGAQWWTDGFCDAPGLPLLPELVKCPYCQTLFWCADVKKLAEIPFWGLDDGKWEEAKSVLDPKEADYLTVANAKGISRDHQLYARKRAWWLANDAVRWRPKGKADWTPARRENLEKLGALLGEKEENNVVLKAEIARELGQFETCAKLLARKFKEKDSAQSAVFLRKLAKEQNSKVALLPPASGK